MLPDTFPVEPFESYMLDDDLPDYPMVFYVRTHLTGRLDRPTFEAAVAAARDRHPLLSSLIVERDGHRLWQRVEVPPCPVIWHDADPIAPAAATARLDLARQTGLRIWVTRRAGRTTIVWEFHHACCDGTGAMQMVEDVLARYAGAKPRPLVSDSLAERRDFGLSRLGRWLRMPLNGLGSFGVAQFFANRPRPLATSDKPSALESAAAGAPAVHTHTFTPAQVKLLQAEAHRAGVTVNDLLLADLFLTLDAWQAEHEPQRRRPCVRISMPVNLRLRRGVAQSAANIVSMVFLDRRPRWYRSPTRLLCSIRRDTWFIKRLRLGLVFTAMLALFARLTGGMSWLLRTDRCLATAVLSNLGVQMDKLPVPTLRGRALLGSVRLEQVELLPPVRHNTRASIGVVTYAGSLTLALHYDARCLGSCSAAHLLSRYVARVHQTALAGVSIPHQWRPAVLEPAPAPIAA